MRKNLIALLLAVLPASIDAQPPVAPSLEKCASHRVETAPVVPDLRKEAVLDYQQRLRSINREKIVDGLPAADAQLPWQVALIIAGSRPQDGQFCGGSIIAADWVLTAAHCVRGFRRSDVDVYTGSVDLRSGGVIHHVSEIISHDQFDHRTYDNDIALLKLATPVPQSAAISVIGPAEEPALLIPGHRLLVSGWGSTVDGGGRVKTLRFAEVPLVDRATCNLKESYDGAVTNNMLCAGFETGGADHCDGDSGGPLVVPAQAPSRLAGIVSWGDACGKPKIYGVYTRVANYSGWITSKLASAHPPPTPEWRINIDWSFANSDAGSSRDCANQYPLPGCAVSGGRSCLMGEAVRAAKANDCRKALEITLATQCHDQRAAETIRTNANSVCEYLKSK